LKKCFCGSQPSEALGWLSGRGNKDRGSGFDISPRRRSAISADIHRFN
jgi:hypothetical protein